MFQEHDFMLSKNSFRFVSRIEWDEVTRLFIGRKKTRLWKKKYLRNEVSWNLSFARNTLENVAPIWWVESPCGLHDNSFCSTQHFSFRFTSHVSPSSTRWARWVLWWRSMRQSCSRKTKWESLARLQCATWIKWGLTSSELNVLILHLTEMTQLSTIYIEDRHLFMFPRTWFYVFGEQL